MQVNLNCTEALINWLSAYLTAHGTAIRKKEKDLPCVVDIIMSSLRNTLRDLLAVYKTLIVLITPLILIVVPLSWNTTVSGNKFPVIYRSLGKFRSHSDATFVFLYCFVISCLSCFDAWIKKNNNLSVALQSAVVTFYLKLYRGRVEINSKRRCVLMFSTEISKQLALCKLY